MEKIRKILEGKLLEMHLVIDDINFEKGQLNITLDSNNGEVLDLNKIVEATKAISPILDKHDFIKDQYILDVSSKERKDN